MLLIQSCDTDFELKRSIFITDPDVPGLPIYSEEGYNTFGAYYDGTPFVSFKEFTSGKWITQQGEDIFTMEGTLREGRYSEVFENMTLQFRFADVDATTYGDLVELNGKEFDLTQEGVVVAIDQNGSSRSVEILEGRLQFSRAQTLLVDKQSMQVILSGRFEFKARVDGVALTVSEGRFDFGFGSHNFYAL